MTGDKAAKPAANEFGVRQMWRVTIAAPIETVWNTIVKTDTVLPFVFGAVCDTESGLAPGKPMRMVSADGKYAIAIGEVLEFDPPHRYSHTIYFTQVKDERPARTTYELREVPGGTELTLMSDAVPGTKMGKMVAGGPFIVENLKAVIETGKPAFSGAMVLALAPLMGLVTPRISRIENWPFTQVQTRMPVMGKDSRQ